MGMFDYFKKDNEKANGQSTENRGIIEEGWNPIYGNVSFNTYSDFSTSKSLKLSVVFRCVSLISDSIASLPLIPYTYVNPNTGEIGEWKYAETNSKLYKLLNVQPNPIMSAFTFKKMIPYHLLYKGNAYIFIERENYTANANSFVQSNGNIKYLHLLNPDLVTPMIDDQGNIFYQYQVKGQKYYEKDIIHIMNFTRNGLVGDSTIFHASQVLGIAYDSDVNAGSFFKSGRNLNGILRPIADRSIPKDKALAAKQSFINATSPQNIQGVNTNGGIVVLDSGLEFQPISINPKDSQLLESRQFNVVDIARFFAVPPALVFHQGDKFSTSEQQQLDYLNNCLSPLLEKIENEFYRKIYPEQNWDKTDLLFDVERLIRLDATAKADYYTKMFNIATYNSNEIRGKVNGAYPVQGGNRFFIQTNLQPIDNLITEQPGAKIPQAPIDNQIKPKE